MLAPAIKQSFNVVMTASMVDKEMQTKRAMTTYAIVQKEPLYEAAPQKKRDVLVSVMRALGHRDPESLVPTMDEIKAWQVGIQQTAMKQALQEKTKIDAKAKAEQEIRDGV